MNILTKFIQNKLIWNSVNKQHTGSKIKTLTVIHTTNYFVQQKKNLVCKSFISYQLFDKNSIDNVKANFLKK